MDSRFAFTEDEIRASFPMSPWEHQFRSVRDSFKMLQDVTSLTLCLPTGAGKTNCAASMINLAQSRGLNCMMLSNRKMLTEQLSDALRKFSIEHGVRAASLPGRLNLSASVQISSMQTELARSIKGDRWEKFIPDVLAVDEAHQFGANTYLKFIQECIAAGTKVVLLTGTPIGISHITPNLVVGATNSELRACGAHVPAIIKCISEFDVSNVVRKKVGADAGDFTEKSTKEWFARQQQIVGICYKDWLRFNPDGRMTLGVAPGSEEAISMAQEFQAHGVPSAAITARGIWANGKEYVDDVNGSARREIDAAWQAGEIKVMWNRFVYREAIDRPGIYHMILATPIGSLKSYLQCLGRAIRKSPQTPDHVIVQDHCGSFFEHGSPNEDRDWHRLYTMTDAEIREERQAKNRADAAKGEEPVCCGNCGTVLKFGKCPGPPRGCGLSLEKTNPGRMRKVIQADGTLIEVENITRLGEEPKKKKTSTESIEQKQWNSIFWAARNSTAKNGMTFKQAQGAYYRKFKAWPPPNLKFMPKDAADFDRRIRAVDFTNLITGRD